MKRYGDFYEKIYNRGNLILAHNKASRLKKNYSSVKNVEADIENKINELQSILKNEEYTLCEEDYSFEIIEDNGKQRELYKLPYYPHRIVQWAIINVVQHVFYKTLITDTYASIPKRGIHKAMKKVRKDIGENPHATQYCLKIDVKKYYPSIDNNILMSMLEKKFKDKKLLNLLRTIIFSRGSKGQPIGSLLSQYLGNFYLSEFGHWCKETLGLKYLYIYCDDIVVLHHDKEYLHKLFRLFKEYLSSHLNLAIKGNWQVFPTRVRGLDFVGYRFFGNRTIVRKRIYIKARYVFSRPYPHRAKSSYYGWFKHCNTNNFLEKYGL